MGDEVELRRRYSGPSSLTMSLVALSLLMLLGHGCREESMYYIKDLYIYILIVMFVLYIYIMFNW